MAGLLDFLSPTDVNNPGTTTVSPNVMGLLGAAAGAAPYLGTSRLPISNAQVIAGMAGGFGQGYTQGLQNIGAAQRNALTAAQLGFYNKMLPALGGLLNGQGPIAAGESVGNPQAAQPQTVPMAFKNGGQPVPGSAPPSVPAPGTPSVSSPLARASQIALLGGLLNMKGLTDYAKMSLDYDPTIKAQLKAAESDASSPLAVALRGEQDAVARQDQTAANMWHLKALQESGQIQVARNSGIVSLLGPNGMPQAYVNPGQGTQYINGVESLIPGAAGARQALSFAEGAGAAGGKTAMTPEEYTLPSAIGTPGQPGYLPAGTELKTLGKNLYPGLGGGSAGVAGSGPAPRTAGAPAGASTGLPAGVVAGVSPTTQEMTKNAGEQAGKNNEAYQTEAELAKDQNVQIDTIRNAAQTFGPGQFAQLRSKGLEWLNTTGLITDDQMNKLGAAQEGTKVGIQLQAAATRVLGAREAAQIFTWMGKSMPNLELSSSGLEKISAFMGGMNDYKIARAELAQNKFNGNDAVGVNNIRNDFIKNSNPMYFIMARSSPADRIEFLKNMGKDKATQFMSSWKTAAQAGYAPELGQ